MEEISLHASFYKPSSLLFHDAPWRTRKIRKVERLGLGIDPRRRVIKIDERSIDCRKLARREAHEGFGDRIRAAYVSIPNVVKASVD